MKPYKDKAARHLLYKEMLVEAQRGEYQVAGFCSLLHFMGMERPGYDDNLESLPELYACKPHRFARAYWCQPLDWRTRTGWLKQAIEKSAP
jgi:hypothetical protein